MEDGHVAQRLPVTQSLPRSVLCSASAAHKPTPPARCAPRKDGGWACRAATARHPEPPSQLRQSGAHLARMEDGHVAQRLPVTRSLPRSVLCCALLLRPTSPATPSSQPHAHRRATSPSSASKVRTSQGWRMGMSRSDCPSTGAPKPTPPAKCAPRKDGGWACRAATARHPEPTSSTTPSSQPHAHRRATSPSSASKVRTSQPPPTSQPPTATATSNRPRPICERPQCPAL